MRSLLVVVVVAGCGAKAPPPAPAAPPPGPAPVSVDAAVVAAVPVDAPPPLPVPPFVPPDPLAAPEPPTPVSPRCRETVLDDQAHEDARQAAAIDRALRAQGFIPLHAAIRAGDPEDPRGGLVVGVIRRCNEAAPIIAMTKSHEVFVVTPRIVARKTVTVDECTTSCRGACGINMPPRAARAIAPPDAVLGAPRVIDVPIDVNVVFHYAKKMNCNVP